MLEKIGDCELVICPINIKKDILKELTSQKKLINYKFMTMEQFKKYAFISYDERSVFFVMKKNKLNYSTTKEYLDNIFIDSEVTNKLRKDLGDLLIKKELIYKNITVIGYRDIDPYIREVLDKNNVKYIYSEQESNSNIVNEFDSQQEEVQFLAEKIISDLKTIDINDMYLIIPSNDYVIDVKRIFKLYNIPVVIDERQSIYSLEVTQKFLNYLKSSKNIEKSLEVIDKNDTFNQIVNVLNRYYFIGEVDDVFLEILENELKQIKIKTNRVEGALKTINVNQVYDKTKHYYMIGFNQNVIPMVHEESGLISDKMKKEKGIFTSIEQNQIEKEKVIEIVNYPNMYISYKKNDRFNSYYPSYLVEDLNLEVKTEKPKYVFSERFNRLYLASLLDDYINYSEVDSNINYLYPTYSDIKYKTYDNKYKKIDKDKLKAFLNNKISISYSSMNNYFLCPFKYYAENILRIRKSENTFPILIGNLFHHVLQNMYSDGFNIDNYFIQFLENKELTPKELFFVNKLKYVLSKDIEVIKTQDSLSEFKTKLAEKKIVVEKKKTINANIVGIIDKISLLDNYVIITDYKTGNVNCDLSNITDGLNMQLPMYIYLIKNGFDCDKKIVGFYLQKLINRPSEDLANDLKLNGYTINDESIIQKIDNSYEDSKVIKGMKKGKSDFYAYSKTISEDKINKLCDIADKNINKVIDAVNEADFRINPKRLKNELISCKYCKYKDLCFYREDDVTNLKQKSFEEIVGDENA